MKLLTVNQLTMRFGENVVIHDVSFSLEKGHCIGLIGPNGAGKTTTLRMLTNLLKPTKGTIDYIGTHNGVDFRSLIGYLPQHPVFFNWMTGREFLRFSGRLTGLYGKELEKRVEELLRIVGLSDTKKKRIGRYSGGMKQRLGIAQAVIHKPELLILDEPVSALDPIGRRDILELLQQLKEEMTILLSTHILNDAEEVCDDIIMIDKGKIVEQSSLNQLLKKNQNYQTYYVELTHSQSYFEEQLRHYGYTILLSEKNNTIVIEMDNSEQSIGKLLQLMGSENWPVVGFWQKYTTLEDVFMKVVRG